MVQEQYLAVTVGPNRPRSARGAIEALMAAGRQQLARRV